MKKTFDLLDNETKSKISVEGICKGKTWMALCPKHDDHIESLAINEEKGVFYCHACKWRGSFYDPQKRKDSNGAKKVLAEYDYQDEEGNLSFQVLRLENKSFRIRRPYGKGGWIWNIQGVDPILYHLPELIRGDDPVFIAEGEKDVQSLKSLGLTATTNPMGAGKWRQSFNQYLKGREVIILPDNDPPGRAHAEDIAKSLWGIVKSIKIVELPGLPNGGDVTDFLKQGGTKEQLLKFAKERTVFNPKDDGDSCHKHHFSLIQAKDILSIEEPETDWLWEGILPMGGLSLVIAKPKVGKTTLAFNLAVAVSRGDDFLVRRTLKGTVVYLALEEKRGEIQKALSKLNVEDENLFFHFGPAPIEAMKEVEPLIRETGAKLLVIDILQKFCRVKDLNDYAQVTRALEPLMAAARELNCHIQLLHHAGKKERADGDDILGSTGLLGGVDTSIHIKKRNKESRIVFTIQRYGQDFPETVVTLRPEGGLEVTGSREEIEVEETLPLILEALSDDPLTINDIWKRVEKRHDLVSKGLNKLVDQREIKKNGSGKKGDPFRYEKIPVFPSPIYMGEGGKEFKGEDNKSDSLNKFLPHHFQKSADVGEGIGREFSPPKGDKKDSLKGDLYEVTDDGQLTY